MLKTDGMKFSKNQENTVKKKPRGEILEFKFQVKYLKHVISANQILCDVHMHSI